MNLYEEPLKMLLKYIAFSWFYKIEVADQLVRVWAFSIVIFS